MPTPETEIHLFIIWENARIKEKEIVEDISKKFDVIRAFEIHWTQEKFSENLSRFYGTQLPPDSRKEVHVGTQPFLAIVVRDKQPTYKIHTTSKGDKRVNTNMFTSKALHREWTGGGHKIHASNTLEEANHNLTMLFGLNQKDFLEKYDNKQTNQIEVWEHDIIGSKGWENLSQLFYVLNNTTRYVVLRNFEQLPNAYYAKDHGDIDLLVENYKDMRFLTNSQEVFRSRHRVYNKVNINGKKVMFDFRHIDDGYYDSLWEKNILANRTLLSKGFYVPDKINHFYSLLYHALIHKPKVSADYVKKLKQHQSGLGKDFNESSLASGEAVKLLSLYMRTNFYNFTQPYDKSVYINLEVISSAKKYGINFKRRAVIPIRNYIKKINFPFKHYLLKIRKIIRRKIRRIDN